MLPDFHQDQKIEAQDQYGKWYVARVVQVDHEEKELLIHFEGWNARYDEWISCNSFRLRPLSMENKRKIQEKKHKKFQVGEYVQARWLDGKYYPAVVKVIDNLCDKGTVQFYQDGIEHIVSLQDIRPQKKQDKQSEWAKAQQEAKEREDRHTALARKSRAKKRSSESEGTANKTPDNSGKKPRLGGDNTTGETSSVEQSLASQSGSITPESGAVSPTPSDDLKSPAAFKRKAYTPLRTQYCLRETVVPIQPLSREQHGNAESPSKITRRITSTEDGEDPLSPQSDNKDSERPKKRRVTKKDKQERTNGKRKQSASTKETATKRSSKKSKSEVVPVAGLQSESFSITPQDTITVASSLPLQILPTVTTHSTPLYTPMSPAHVSPNQDHLIPDVPPSPSDASTISTECNISVISDGKDLVGNSNDKISPVGDPKSISLTPFNMEVDLLNNEDSKSVGSPAVVTIDPTAAHSPVGDSLATSSIGDCDPNEDRPFVEGTKKTATIISKSSPKRPSLLPLRRRSLSASSQTGVAARIPAGGKERRKSEGERNMVRRRQQQSTITRSPRKTSMDSEKEMAPKELVIKMDHNEFKCRFPGCGKSFRKESLLQWHYKHYHPGRNLPVRSQVNTAPVPKIPMQKSPSNRPPQAPPSTLPVIVKQQEPAIPAPTKAAISTVIPKLELEKTKVMKQFVATAPLIPVFAVITPPGTPLASTPQSSATKEPSSKASTPMLLTGTPNTPTITGFDTKRSLGAITSLPNVNNVESIKLPSSMALELLKGSAVRMVAPKPTVVRVTPTTTTTTTTTHAVTSTPIGISSTNIGAIFRGFPPVTMAASSMLTATHLGRPVSTMARPSSPKKGVMIRGHPRGEMPRDSRPRGASFTNLSDDSSAEDVDVGEEYYQADRYPRASRPFGSSSCSYYCSGNKDDVIHCLCGSFEDEGFMIQCEQCLCWQHADCVGIDEEQPPEHYLCCICQSPLALRKNAKYKFDRSWYRDGKLPSVMGGVPFAHSSDVITSHEISSSLTNLSQCLHSLEQLLSVAGQPNHPLLKHWDSGKESAITRKLTERLATMLKDRESVKMDSVENSERSARTTPINEQQVRGGTSNDSTKQLQLAPLPPLTTSASEEVLTHVSDDRVSSDSSINVTCVTSLTLPPLPPHRRKLFDDDSNPSTPRLRDDSVTPPCGEETEEMDCEHNGLELLTAVAATCSRLSTPSTISQDKSPKQDLSPLPVADLSTPASADTATTAPIASFNDEFGVEEASVFALTPSTVTSPEIEQPMMIDQQQSASVPETPENDDTQRQEEIEPCDENSEPVMEMIERLASNLDTTAQLLPLVTPSQFAEAFMKVDNSCWNSRMLLLDHVEAMQEKVLAEIDKLEEQYKTLPEIHYSPEESGTKKELIKKMNEWQRLDITYAA
ncbi:PHD finger protein 20-like isoform X2 [Dysidea avara]|uniref:PHD finger protein 20-like isoform X2 n=1 Tax=Dysidea avara TaxID=196820 RepID=UPI00331CF6AB